MSDLVGITFSLIFGGIIGFIVGYFSGYLSGKAVVNYQRKLDISDKRKDEIENSLKQHKNDLANFIRRFRNLKVECDKFSIWKLDDFDVKINELDELKGDKRYNQIIQHFNEYPNIKNNLDNSEDIIIKLDNNLKDLRKYLLDKINNDFKVVPNHLNSGIWCVIENTKLEFEKIMEMNLDEFLDGIEISKRPRTIHIDTNDGISLGQVPCKNEYLDNIFSFLSDLFKKDKEFKKELNDFLNEYQKLHTTFGDFKNHLNELLQDIDVDENNLKGDCDKCRLWIKEIG